MTNAEAPQAYTQTISEERNQLGENTGVELEREDQTGSLGEIGEPFDPDEIEVQTRSMTIGLMISRLRHKAVDLDPEFQRRRGIWTDIRQSRLIESILLKIPLPTFYAAEDEEENWSIVDGIQRLTAIARFIEPSTVGDGQLKLIGLEYLGQQFDGKIFKDLTPKMMRRLEETEIVVHVIRHGTPEVVKHNIFARINTGGIPLSAQELRHALIGGQARTLLRDWAKDERFLQATAYAISDDRMSDRELVLRFIAFRLTKATDFRPIDFDRFLGQAMREVNTWSEKELLLQKNAFDRAMEVSADIFGDDAFRKRYRKDDGRFPINKALFEAVAVTLSELSINEQNLLVERSDQVKDQFIELMADRAFERAISQGTGDPAKVRLRFDRIQKLFWSVMDD
ncbi:DUF262 domain-containing protein [Stutzerimonas xanthomarina]|uniref:GmrSD restriction endonucleases N-terminal domain-containing protein n=2 Tax=Stutzerimonas xanthomarina TaxID=271420 RepID=A0A1M5TAK8_9GAMM|nr:DUF262 domain-containing protein [Stutzerimonas xanthomarina]MCP9340343.1 DUF262 domain-containing protein [Stutzerimonas xanthomarina]SEH61187.1 Protein of unknown function DUF262 [Stutzerimonas xanthomarina]SHH47825.1 Protein of unknown function DUF262 [Stutzerimonas xanthomarina DSM 18231]